MRYALVTVWKLLGTSALLLVTSALLVVTRNYAFTRPLGAFLDLLDRQNLCSRYSRSLFEC